MKRTPLVLGAVVILAVAGWFLFAPDSGLDVFASDKTTAPASANSFSVTTLDGKTFDLAKQKGNVVLVNFWATWCAPCRNEIPHFVDLSSELHDQGLRIIGISVDRNGRQVVDPFLDQTPVNYPIALDPGSVLFQKYQQLIDASMRGGIPFTLIFDDHGNIAYKLVGYRDKDQWLALIRPLLDNRSR